MTHLFDIQYEIGWLNFVFLLKVSLPTATKTHFAASGRRIKERTLILFPTSNVVSNF